MKIPKRFLLLTTIFSGCAGNIFSGNSPDFVVIHSDSPGTLVLSRESLTAPCLKVTGDIDATDIQRLKTVTMNVTRTLDMSEATIHGYSGTEGTKAPGLQGDWIIGDGDGPVTYPADFFPVNAFVETRNNSLSKYHRGSESLSRLILPKSLKGFMRDALTLNEYLVDLDLPENSPYLHQEEGLIYSADGTTLLQLPPACYGNVTVAATVKSVAGGVFGQVSPASVTFLSNEMPSFDEDNEISAAYIVAPDPSPYADAFQNGVDCVRTIDVIEVECQTPSQLLTAIGNMGYSRADVRSVRVTGSINYDDLTQLLDLPNIHIADLSNAVCEVNDAQLYIGNPSLTTLKFPSLTGHMSVEISEQCRLYGNLVVPEGVWGFSSSSPRFRSIDFPSSLQYVGDRLFYSGSVVESLDFSKCRQLETIDGLAFAACLTDVKLPPAVKKISGFGAPLKDLNLPASLSHISSEGGWLMEDLTLPASLTYCYIYALPRVKSINAAEATALNTFGGLGISPSLETLDLSRCPVYRLDNIFRCDEAYAESPAKVQAKVVASGGTHYPAPAISAIRAVKLPSTLVQVRGFNNCPDLERLDLMGCFRLEWVEGIENCGSLRSLSLPETTFTINGLSSLPSLSEIRSAASAAPRISSNSEAGIDFSGVDLYVPDGCAGAYRMAETWEKCKTINDEGHVVSFDTSSLAGVADNPALVLLEGAGLYAPGSSASLFAPPSGNLSVSGWKVNGETLTGNPLLISADENIVASPICMVDPDLCDIVMELSAPVAQTMILNIYAAGDKKVILDGETIFSRNDSWKTLSAVKISLASGPHTLAVMTSDAGISFDDSENQATPDDFYRITSFKVNAPDALYYLLPSHFDMDTLNLSGATALDDVSCYNETNRIGFIDVSDCQNLTSLGCRYTNLTGVDFGTAPIINLDLGDNLIEEIDLSRLTGLKSLNIYGNKLKKLDLSGLDLLESVGASDNLLTEFYLTSPVCTKLDLWNNPMAFSTLTPLIYDIYMKMWKDSGKDMKAYQIPFKTDVENVDSTGLLDLSAEMQPQGSSVRTEIIINGEVAADEDGILSLPAGYYTITLTNADYPDLVYITFVNSSYVEPSAPSGVRVEIDGIIYSLWGDWLGNEGVNRADVEPVSEYWLGEGVAPYSGNVVIPAQVEYEGFVYDVTDISEQAFADCPDLKSISIPPSIINVGPMAFARSNGLEAVHIRDLAAWLDIDFPNSSWANPLEFAHNLYLDGELVKEIHIPEGSTMVRRFVLSGCNSIEKVVIPEGVRSVGSCAFNSCESLVEVDFPSTLEEVEFAAFSGCVSLSAAELPLSVSKIGNNAFSDCDALVEIEIPSLTSKIGNDAFWSCDNLKKVTFNEGLKLIDFRAFGNCTALEDINLPASLEKISTNAFYNCHSLRNPVLPENIDTISSMAFYGADIWEVINLPASLSALGDGAFSCRNLKVLSVGCEAVPDHIGTNSPFMLADYENVLAAFRSDALPTFADNDFFKWFISDKHKIEIVAPDNLRLNFTSPAIESESLPWGMAGDGYVVCVPNRQSVVMAFPENVLEEYSIFYNDKDISGSLDGRYLHLDHISADATLEVRLGNSVDGPEADIFRVEVDGRDLIVRSDSPVRIFNSQGMTLYDGAPGRIAGLPQGNVFVVSGRHTASIFIR